MVLPTVTWLLGRPQLRLKLLGEAADVRHAAHVDAPITWVHSSDLDDPTPFLSAGNVLLTDGAQFGFGPDTTQYDYAAYVQRLVEAQLVGLGFATHFLHQGTPPELAHACESAGLPLIEVPDRVPFIAVIREVADQIAAERNQRLEWSIAAHKAISRAALKPDGLRSILLELERRLDCWVGLFDAAGNYLPLALPRPTDERFSTLVRNSVGQALSKGRRSSTSLSIDSSQVTIQTLGHGGELRGALALGRRAPLDRAENELVTSVIALASLALEQNRALDAARADLRSAVIELLIAGSPSAARAIAEQLGSTLPAEPFTVFVIATATVSAATAAPVTATSTAATSAATGDRRVRDSLDLLSAESDGRVFFAARGTETVVLAAPGDHENAVAHLVAFHQLPAGSATVADYSQLNTALGQASAALSAARGRPSLIRFADIAQTGMLGLLHSAQAGPVARRVLTPLVDFDAEHSTVLVDTLRVWLAHDCSWGETAAQLGVHRHTVRARVDNAATIVGLDLESFEGRLELWAALQAMA